MKLAIMQPYILPYIGYFQLISSVDFFLACDNMQYTRKGWINRNRILQNGKDILFSLPLKHASQTANISEREITSDFNRERFLKQFSNAYKKCVFFEQTLPLLERILGHQDLNLFNFNLNSIKTVCDYLGIQTKIGRTSDIPINPLLKKEERVIALCQSLNADTYINSIGGRELYSKDRFKNNGISLAFLESSPLEYKQFHPHFIPWLSIVDILMFNPIERVREMVSSNYELV
ncbi:MAG: WbqC-like protein family protein [Verrucomicrobia bacterium]|nr:MAG: WbqC-like protein family protein [Verrucomicrobiota bacterium]